MVVSQYIVAGETPVQNTNTGTIGIISPVIHVDAVIDNGAAAVGLDSAPAVLQNRVLLHDTAATGVDAVTLVGVTEVELTGGASLS